MTDLAGVLSPDDEAKLERELEQYAKKTGHEIAILVLEDLGGRYPEEIALQVGREWKLGRPGHNDGAVLLVARDERRVRIEVGRGLEGTLTDSISGRIIRDAILPRFRTGDYFGGLLVGLQAMQAAIGGEALPVAPRRRGAPPGLLVAIVFFVLLFTLISARRGRGGRGRRGRSLWLPGPVASPFGRHTSGGWGGFGGGGFGGGSSGGGGGFGGFGGGGGFSGGGASGRW